MSENQKPLTFSHICANPRRRDAEKHDFRHYMAQIGPNFPSKTSLGSENPWDGSPDPWDGKRNPWDGATGQPHRAAFPTLKGGARRVSALTLCHIAHKVSRAAEGPPQPKPHREAGDPIGIEPSITAGEPKANPRKGHSQQWDPIGVQQPRKYIAPGRRDYPRTPKPHHEAGDPIGVELSITAGEPKANPRKGPTQQWDPIGVQLPVTAGTPQAHPRSARCGHPPRPQATHPCARTTAA